MNSLLYSFLNDLLQRCRRLNQELIDLVSLPTEVSSYREWVAKLLQSTEKRIENLLQDPDIKLTELAKNYYHDYKRLAELVWNLEWRPILALTRYSDTDRLATLICHQIAQEINYPYDPPICVALSSQHYWTDPRFRLILIPPVEPFHLLGLSDIYHEIGHIILFQKQEIELHILNLIDQYFNQVIKRLEKEGNSSAHREAIENYKEMWKKVWAKEFASDMIATYLAGPAYGWANVRLCSNLSTDIYADDPNQFYTHPADAARTKAIEIMLNQMGLEQDALKIKELWNQLVVLTGQVEPQEFGFRFPYSLIEQLCRIVSNSCKNLRLMPYSDQSGNSAPLHITRLLNEAWNKFISDSETFAEWETVQINRLKTIFGL